MRQCIFHILHNSFHQYASSLSLHQIQDHYSHILSYSDGIHEFSGSDDNVGYRFGAGAQYNITGHWALRGMVRYVVLDSEYIDDMLEFSLGMRYTF